jgi:hypothetical protein
MALEEQYQHTFYIYVDENGDPVDGAYVDPNNIFWMFGGSWEFTLADAAERGLVPVIDSNKVFTNGEGIIETEMGDLVNNGDGTYTQQWIEREISAEEKRMRFLERTRDNLLFQSDWTQLADVQLSDEKKAEWAAYRQALRDLPDSIDWDNVTSSADINWPRVPAASDSNEVVEPDPEETAANNPFLESE